MVALRSFPITSDRWEWTRSVSCTHVKLFLILKEHAPAFGSPLNIRNFFPLYCYSSKILLSMHKLRRVCMPFALCVPFFNLLLYCKIPRYEGSQGNDNVEYRLGSKGQNLLCFIFDTLMPTRLKASVCHKSSECWPIKTWTSLCLSVGRGSRHFGE
jgi:hypothetical protein